MIHVVVADDHAVVRTGVRAVLGSEPDLSVVAEAADAGGAVAAVVAHHPEVLLLDWTLPGDGRSVIERLRTEAPATRICVLSMHQDGATVREALGVRAVQQVRRLDAGTTSREREDEAEREAKHGIQMPRRALLPTARRVRRVTCV